jgi:DNA polymerase-3 subunit epsilon
MLDLNLDRPLVFFDLETTGTNIQIDRIVEISVIKIQPSGEKEIKTRRINPEMHIPKEASDIHGIRDEDVADEPTFKAISKNFYIFLEGCDLGGYNIVKFDIPMLKNEFNRYGLEFSTEGRRIVDPYIMFCQLFPRTLSGAYKFFCEKEMENAHSAEADTIATLEIFEAQLEKYPELPRTLESLHEYCDQSDPSWIDSTGKFKWREDGATVGFGKNSGIPLKSIALENPGFLKWMINADFPDDAKEIASNALKGEFPERDE